MSHKNSVKGFFNKTRRTQRGGASLSVDFPELGASIKNVDINFSNATDKMFVNAFYATGLVIDNYEVWYKATSSDAMGPWTKFVQNAVVETDATKYKYSIRRKENSSQKTFPSVYPREDFKQFTYYSDETFFNSPFNNYFTQQELIVIDRIRRVRGGGNCYYISVMYGLFESIIARKDFKKLQEVLDVIKNQIALAETIKITNDENLLKNLLTTPKEYLHFFSIIISSDESTEFSIKNLMKTYNSNLPKMYLYNNFKKEYDKFIKTIENTILFLKNGTETAHIWKTVGDFETDFIHLEILNDVNSSWLENIMVLILRLLISINSYNEYTKITDDKKPDFTDAVWQGDINVNYGNLNNDNSLTPDFKTTFVNKTNNSSLTLLTDDQHLSLIKDYIMRYGENSVSKYTTLPSTLFNINFASFLYEPTKINIVVSDPLKNTSIYNLFLHRATSHYNLLYEKTDIKKTIDNLNEQNFRLVARMILNYNLHFYYNFIKTSKFFDDCAMNFLIGDDINNKRPVFTIAWSKPTNTKTETLENVTFPPIIDTIFKIYCGDIQDTNKIDANKSIQQKWTLVFNSKIQEKIKPRIDKNYNLLELILTDNALIGLSNNNYTFLEWIRTNYCTQIKNIKKTEQNTKSLYFVCENVRIPYDQTGASRETQEYANEKKTYNDGFVLFLNSTDCNCDKMYKTVFTENEIKASVGNTISSSSSSSPSSSSLSPDYEITQEYIDAIIASIGSNIKNQNVPDPKKFKIEALNLILNECAIESNVDMFKYIRTKNSDVNLTEAQWHNLLELATQKKIKEDVIPKLFDAANSNQPVIQTSVQLDIPTGLIKIDYETSDFALEKITSSKFTYKFSEKGIANAGNTCYFNSVIQCLIHTEPFINFLHNYQPTTTTTTPTSIFEIFKSFYGYIISLDTAKTLVASDDKNHIFKTLVNLKPRQKNIVTPFLKRLGNKQQDASEFLTPLINTMDETEFCANKNKLEPHCVEFKQLFYRMLRTTVTCKFCGYEKTSKLEDPESIINVSISGFNIDELVDHYDEKTKGVHVDAIITAFDSDKNTYTIKKTDKSVVKDVKFGSLRKKYTNSTTNNVDTTPQVPDDEPIFMSNLIHNEFDENMLPDDEPVECSNCKNPGVYKRQQILSRLPQIFICCPKRFSYQGTSTKKTNPLDVNHAKNSSLKLNSVEYELFATANHDGNVAGNESGAHYFAWIKNESSQWKNFNDESAAEDATTTGNNLKTPYLLFYKRKDAANTRKLILERDLFTLFLNNSNSSDHTIDDIYGRLVKSPNNTQMKDELQRSLLFIAANVSGRDNSKIIKQMLLDDLSPLEADTTGNTPLSAALMDISVKTIPNLAELMLSDKITDAILNGNLRLSNLTNQTKYIDFFSSPLTYFDSTTQSILTNAKTAAEKIINKFKSGNNNTTISNFFSLVTNPKQPIPVLNPAPIPVLNPGAIPGAITLTNLGSNLGATTVSTTGATTGAIPGANPGAITLTNLGSNLGATTVSTTGATTGAITGAIPVSSPPGVNQCPIIITFGPNNSISTCEIITDANQCTDSNIKQFTDSSPKTEKSQYITWVTIVSNDKFVSNVDLFNDYKSNCNSATKYQI